MATQKADAKEVSASSTSSTTTASAPAKKQNLTHSGYATVKAVLSGDTLILVGSAGVDQVPQEKQVILSGITAPRCQRGKSGQDEPFGWHSREFLRKKCIGKQVQFESFSTGKAEFAHVKLGSENLAHAMVQAGWAHVRPLKGAEASVSADREELLKLEAAAAAAGLGLHGKAKSTVRHINFEVDSAAYFARLKNTPIPAVVDQVRDGSTLRVEMLNPQNPSGDLDHTMITLCIAGVQCPKMPMMFAPKAGEEKEKKAKAAAAAGDEEDVDVLVTPTPAAPQKLEPWTCEAHLFTELRLLHRDVQIILLSVDKSNTFYGQVVLAAGNIAERLLQEGYGKLVEWTAKLTTDYEKLIAAQKQAQQKQLRRWKGKSADEVARKEGTVRVVSVQSGDTLVVADEKGVERKVTLASIKAPKMPWKEEKGESYAWDAREFLRKRLVGRKVRMIEDYTRDMTTVGSDRKQPPRVFVSISVNNKSIAEQLVAAGLADVVRHRQDDPRSADFPLLLDAETKAKEQKVGKHTIRPLPPYSFADLTERFRGGEVKGAADFDRAESAQRAQRTNKNKVQSMFTILKHEPQEAVVEHVFSGARLKLHVPKHSCMISFALAGVHCDPAKSRETGEENPAGVAAMNFTRQQLLQHDVHIEIEAVDKGDNFIGTLFINKQNMAVTLLEEGLAKVMETADRNKYAADLYAAEDKAKQARKGIWKNFDPNARPMASGEEVDVAAEHKWIQVKVTEIIDPTDFFVQIDGDVNIQNLESKMKEWNGGASLSSSASAASSSSSSSAASAAAGPFKPERGMLCGGFWEEGWYRVRIEGPAGENSFYVFFTDYGNHDVLETSQLKPLPQELVQLPPVVHVATLAGIKVPRNYGDEAVNRFHELVWDKVLLSRCEMSDRNGRLHLVLHDQASPSSVNQTLLRDGLARLKSKPDRRLRALLDSWKSDEEHAQKERLNVWEYGNVSDSEDEEEKEERAPRKKGGRAPAPKQQAPAKKAPEKKGEKKGEEKKDSKVAAKGKKA